MRLWMFEAIYEPWLVNYWHKRTDKMVVWASNEKQARDVADQTYCEEVNDSGVPKVIMMCS